MLTFCLQALANRGWCPIYWDEAAGLELPCFISLSLVPTQRPDSVRALFSCPAYSPAGRRV